MNLCTYYCLCGFMIGVHLYILCVQWFYAACSLALRWPWGSSLCPCCPQDWVIVLFSWWSCQHNSSIRMQSQECTCLRYWGCITLALHSLQADFNLAIWFWKSVTLAALGASVIASLELYVGEVVKCLCALVLAKIPSFIWGWQMFVLWLWYPLDCFSQQSFHLISLYYAILFHRCFQNCHVCLIYTNCLPLQAFSLPHWNWACPFVCGVFSSLLCFDYVVWCCQYCYQQRWEQLQKVIDQTIIILFGRMADTMPSEDSAEFW